MIVGGKKLSSFQENFVKDLMGDPFMTDVRAEALLNKLTHKYGADIPGMLEAAAVPFEKKHAEFKKLEAEELAKA